jgi:hypothetical protein
VKVTIDLTPEDLRKLISGKISNECSKHGHPSGMEPKILVRLQDQEDPLLLGELVLAVHAEIEVS